MKPLSTEHVPVLLSSLLPILNLSYGKTIVDATLGGGGYTRAFLHQVGETGKVIALDWDQSALERFRNAAVDDVFLSDAFQSGRLKLIHSSYAEIVSVLKKEGLEKVDAIVADLGISSDQLADSQRGISFQFDGPLDMRLSSGETVTAAAIVATWNEDSLADLFEVYGDEPESRRIAKAIVQERKKKPLSTTMELRDLIFHNVSSQRRRGKAHPATRVFQALRIAVNSEQEHLERFLSVIPHVLLPHGRSAIVSFHSGEDRLVKQWFQNEVRANPPRLRWVTKKPIVPTREEVQKNPRARSAKLRVVERVQED